MIWGQTSEMTETDPDTGRSSEPASTNKKSTLLLFRGFRTKSNWSGLQQFLNYLNLTSNEQKPPDRSHWILFLMKQTVNGEAETPALWGHRQGKVVCVILGYIMILVWVILFCHCDLNGLLSWSSGIVAGKTVPEVQGTTADMFTDRCVRKTTQKKSVPPHLPSGRRLRSSPSFFMSFMSFLFCFFNNTVYSCCVLFIFLWVNVTQCEW